MGFKLIAACILVAAEAYLLGSIVFGILISKHFCTTMCAPTAAAARA